MTQTDYDVLICGAGMAGAGLASVLALHGLTVGVLENQACPPVDLSMPFDLRVSALNKSTQDVLSQTKAWDNIQALRACPFTRMRVWEQGGFGNLVFDANKGIQHPQLGFIVENSVTQYALWQVLQANTKVDLLCPQTPVSATRQGDYIQVTTQENNHYRARLLVGADGINSWVRNTFAIDTKGHGYDQACLVASVGTQLGQQSITWQRFTPTGPQAFLPLPGQHGSVVWYHQADEVKRLAVLDKAQLGQAIMAAFPDELGSIEVLNHGHFAIQKQHANDYVQTNVALIGDAAHTLNPMAGQGVNLAFQDVACLAQVIKQAIQEGQPWWSQRVLKQYQQARWWPNKLMLDAMDVFYHGFNQPNKGIKWLRNSALSIAHVSPFKREVIRYAMGMESHTGKLLKKLAK